VRPGAPKPAPAISIAEAVAAYQQRIHKIIEAQMGSIESGTMPTEQRPLREIPDLMENIRLSLAQIESKKSESKPTKSTEDRYPGEKREVKAGLGESPSAFPC
jgi:non-homologous end joining protein Ku